MRHSRMMVLLLSVLVLTVGASAAQSGVRISSPITANGGAFLHIARSIGQQLDCIEVEVRRDDEGIHARWTPDRKGKWSEEETRLLFAMRREGLSRRAIGRILQRSEKSVKTRIEKPSVDHPLPRDPD